MPGIPNALSFIATLAVDVVGVYTQDFKQVFPTSRPIKATITPAAKLMEHPLETGATIADHRIILPTEIELSMLVPTRDYDDTYQLIKQIWLAGTILTVQTRTGTYPNQIIASIPHEEDPSMYDVIALAMKLKEALFVTPEFGIVPRRPKDSNTTNRGIQQTSPASGTQESGAKEGFHWIKDKLGGS